MEIYFVTKEALHNGAHEIHKKHCTRLPLHNDVYYLGAFASSNHAIVAAKTFYEKTVRCSLCNQLQPMIDD